MSKELQTWFRQMPMRSKRDLARGIREIANELAEEIREAAPVGSTGNLRSSVTVRRGRNELELYVEAGGSETTKEVREGSGVDYDYALAQEFGTSKMDANPFFYTTYRDVRDEYRQKIADLVAEVVSG